MFHCQEELLAAQNKPGFTAKAKAEKMVTMSIAYHNLAVELEYTHRLDMCLQWYKKAVSIASKYAHSNKALVKMFVKSYEAAKSEVRCLWLCVCVRGAPLRSVCGSVCSSVCFPAQSRPSAPCGGAPALPTQIRRQRTADVDTLPKSRTRRAHSRSLPRKADSAGKSAYNSHVGGVGKPRRRPRPSSARARRRTSPRRAQEPEVGDVQDDADDQSVDTEAAVITARIEELQAMLGHHNAARSPGRRTAGDGGGGRLSISGLHASSDDDASLDTGRSSVDHPHQDLVQSYPRDGDDMEGGGGGSTGGGDVSNGGTGGRRAYAGSLSSSGQPPAHLRRHRPASAQYRREDGAGGGAARPPRHSRRPASASRVRDNGSRASGGAGSEFEYRQPGRNGYMVPEEAGPPRGVPSDDGVDQFVIEDEGDDAEEEELGVGAPRLKPAPRHRRGKVVRQAHQYRDGDGGSAAGSPTRPRRAASARRDRWQPPGGGAQPGVRGGGSGAVARRGHPKRPQSAGAPLSSTRGSNPGAGGASPSRRPPSRGSNSRAMRYARQQEARRERAREQDTVSARHAGRAARSADEEDALRRQLRQLQHHAGDTSTVATADDDEVGSLPVFAPHVSAITRISSLAPPNGGAGGGAAPAKSPRVSYDTVSRKAWLRDRPAASGAAGVPPRPPSPRTAPIAPAPSAPAPSHVQMDSSMLLLQERDLRHTWDAAKRQQQHRRQRQVDERRRARQEEEAATHMQRLARGRQARLYARSVRTERALEARWQARRADETRAAVEVQRLARGRQQRRHVRSLKQERELEARHQRRREAAVRVQALARGHSDRRLVANMRARGAQPPPPSSSSSQGRQRAGPKDLYGTPSDGRRRRLRGSMSSASMGTSVSGGSGAAPSADVVDSFLAAAGLSKFRPAFRRESMDAGALEAARDELPHLDDALLVALGLTRVGDRLKFKKALADFDFAAAAAAPRPVAPTPPRAPSTTSASASTASPAHRRRGSGARVVPPPPTPAPVHVAAVSDREERALREEAAEHQALLKSEEARLRAQAQVEADERARAAMVAEAERLQRAHDEALAKAHADAEARAMAKVLAAQADAAAQLKVYEQARKEAELRAQDEAKARAKAEAEAAANARAAADAEARAQEYRQAQEAAEQLERAEAAALAQVRAESQAAAAAAAEHAALVAEARAKAAAQAQAEADAAQIAAAERALHAERAAARIQAIARGTLARREAATRRARRRSFVQRQQEAAAKLQATYRGHITRAKLGQGSRRRSDPGVVPAPPPPSRPKTRGSRVVASDEHRAEMPAMSEHQAATAVQATFRGWSTRAVLKGESVLRPPPTPTLCRVPRVMNGEKYDVSITGDLWEGVSINALSLKTFAVLEPLELSLPQVVSALGLRFPPDSQSGLVAAAKQLATQVVVVGDVAGPSLRVLSRKQDTLKGHIEALGRTRSRLYQACVQVSGRRCIVSLLEGVRRSSNVRDLAVEPRATPRGPGLQRAGSWRSMDDATDRQGLVFVAHDVLAEAQYRLSVQAGAVRDVVGPRRLLDLTTRPDEEARRDAFLAAAAALRLEEDPAADSGRRLVFHSPEAKPAASTEEARAAAASERGDEALPARPKTAARKAARAEAAKEEEGKSSSSPTSRPPRVPPTVAEQPEGSAGSTVPGKQAAVVRMARDDDGNWQAFTKEDEEAAAVRIQAAARGVRTRAEIRQKQHAAAEVQALYRGRSARRHLQQQQQAAARIQAVHRGVATRQRMFDEAVRAEEVRVVD